MFEKRKNKEWKWFSDIPVAEFKNKYFLFIQIFCLSKIFY